MGRLQTIRWGRDLLLGGCVALGALSLLLWPDRVHAAVEEGMHLCAHVLLPSLFPFFVLAELVVNLGLSRYLGQLLEPLMRPLFRVNGAGASALVLGLVGGYPLGAKTAVQLYQSGQCSRAEAERLLAFCNNCGPAFVLGAVGTGIFGSNATGVLLYATHVAAAVLVGLAARFYKWSEPPSPGSRQPQVQTAHLWSVFPEAVIRALRCVMHISAFVLFFSVAVRMLDASGLGAVLARILALCFSPLGLTQEDCARLLVGLLEVSSGVGSLATTSPATQLPMAAFLLGWAGLSVHCQVMAFLGDSGLSVRPYLAGKCLHGLLAALLTHVVLRIYPMDLPVSFLPAQSVNPLASPDFSRAFALSCTAAWIAWLVFFGMTLLAIQKSGGKRRRHGV